MTKKVVLTTNIKRDKEHLFCCGTSEDGYVTVMQVDRSERSKGKKKVK